MLALSDLLTPATVDAWFATLLSYASSTGLNVTAWQTGGVTRTILRIVASALSVADGVVSTYAAGGFLDYAASVSPTYGPGWIDALASSVYAVTRLPATTATTTIRFTNSTASVYGAFAAGTFHVADATTKAVYTNVGALTIGASGTTDATFAADVAGASSGASAITTMVTTLVGVTCNNAAAAVATPAETSTALALRCKAKLAALGPKLGAVSAYVYFAITSSEANYPTLAGGPITRAARSADTTTGAVTVTIANALGAPAGGDVTLMQTYLQAYCTPDGTPLTVQAATNVTVNATVHVYVPAAYAGIATIDAQTAFAAYIRSVPIGGYPDEDAGSGVPHGGLSDALARAMPYLRTQQLQITGAGTEASLPLASTEVALAGTLTVTEHLF